MLADRLWRGDPPELWEAAQRLLDARQDRHLVLHALMAVLDHTSGDEAALIAVLRELEADEPLQGDRVSLQLRGDIFLEHLHPVTPIVDSRMAPP